MNWEPIAAASVVFGTVSLYMFGVPLLVRALFRFPLRPECLELDAEDFHPAVADFCVEVGEALERLGFGDRVSVRVADAAPNLEAHWVGFVNAAGDEAMVVGNRVQEWKVWRPVHSVEFGTEFETGEAVVTTNLPDLLAFAPPAGAVVTQVPTLRDPAELWRLHLFMLDRHAPPGRVVGPPKGEGVPGLMRRALTSILEREAERGTLYLDEDAELYRFSALGVFPFTWRLLQPIKAYRLWRMRRREAKVLREFERTGNYN